MLSMAEVENMIKAKVAYAAVGGGGGGGVS